MFREAAKENSAVIASSSAPSERARVILIHPIPERLLTPPAITDKNAIIRAKIKLHHAFNNSVTDIFESKKDAVLGELRGKNPQRIAKEILVELFHLGQITILSRRDIKDARDCNRRNLVCVAGKASHMVSEEQVIGSFVFHKSRKQQTEKFVFIPFSFIEPGLMLKFPLSENTMEELSKLVTKIGDKIDKSATPIEIKPSLRILKGSIEWLKMHACKKAQEHSDYLAEVHILREDVKEAEDTRQLNNPNRANKQVRDVLDHPFNKKRKKHQRRAARPRQGTSLALHRKRAPTPAA